MDERSDQGRGAAEARSVALDVDDGFGEDFGAEALAPASVGGGGGSTIDRLLGHFRFYHAFNLLVIALVVLLVVAAPQLTILPLYLAAIARIPVQHLQREHGFRFGWAVAIVIVTSFLTLGATVVAIILPVILQAAQLDAAALAQAQPLARDLVEWARGLLTAMGFDVAALQASIDLTPEGLLKLVKDMVGGGGAWLGKAALAVLSPFVLVLLSFLVLFMAAYALGYSPSLSREVRRFLRVCWPDRTVAIAERLAVHAQKFGADVFRGYSWMVLVLGLSYFVAFMGALALFPAARDLPPMIIVALVVLSGVIGAIPGLGAKVLLVIGALAGVLVGLLAAAFTGSVWLGVYITAVFTVVTGFESKFGTPNTLGKALGVNSCLMLFLAIATVAGYGFTATLWLVFVGLPIMVGAMKVMVELYGEPRKA